MTELHGRRQKLQSGGTLVTYEVTKIANSVGYAVRMGYAPDAAGMNLEALVTVGEAPYCYNEGVACPSAESARVPPATWEQPKSMYA